MNVHTVAVLIFVESLDCPTEDKGIPTDGHLKSMNGSTGSSLELFHVLNVGFRLGFFFAVKWEES